ADWEDALVGYIGANDLRKVGQILIALGMDAGAIPRALFYRDPDETDEVARAALTAAIKLFIQNHQPQFSSDNYIETVIDTYEGGILSSKQITWKKVEDVIDPLTNKSVDGKRVVTYVKTEEFGLVVSEQKSWKTVENIDGQNTVVTYTLTYTLGIAEWTSCEKNYYSVSDIEATERDGSVKIREGIVVNIIEGYEFGIKDAPTSIKKIYYDERQVASALLPANWNSMRWSEKLNWLVSEAGIQLPEDWQEAMFSASRGDFTLLTAILTALGMNSRDITSLIGSVNNAEADEKTNVMIKAINSVADQYSKTIPKFKTKIVKVMENYDYGMTNVSSIQYTYWDKRSTYDSGSQTRFVRVIENLTDINGVLILDNVQLIYNKVEDYKEGVGNSYKAGQRVVQVIESYTYYDTDGSSFLDSIQYVYKEVIDRNGQQRVATVIRNMSNMGGRLYVDNVQYIYMDKIASLGGRLVQVIESYYLEGHLRSISVDNPQLWETDNVKGLDNVQYIYKEKLSKTVAGKTKDVIVTVIMNNYSPDGRPANVFLESVQHVYKFETSSEYDRTQGRTGNRPVTVTENHVISGGRDYGPDLIQYSYKQIENGKIVQIIENYSNFSAQGTPQPIFENYQKAYYDKVPIRYDGSVSDKPVRVMETY
ncbi:MAG: hypothetical protein COW92_00475, partial [Candidatus Omnitrophica bacterium CG22_combo_CG10-13_8_21_14_all_43_16]